MYLLKAILFISLLILITGIQQSIGQQISKSALESYEYIFPVPDSKHNSLSTNIIIRFGGRLDLPNPNQNVLKVTGNKSGSYTGRIVEAEKGTTLLFYPDKEFQKGEVITVELVGDVHSVDGGLLPKFTYQFQTSNSKLDEKKRVDKILLNELVKSYQVKSRNTSSLNEFKKSSLLDSLNLPSDFPPLSADIVNEPYPGYLFFTPFIIPSGGAASLEDLIPTYLIITDNYGIPVFYRKMNSSTYDFKKLKNGQLSYYEIGTSRFYLMDSSYNVIDSLSMIGYQTDLHELEVSDNNHYLMMAYDGQTIAMDTVVEGGSPNAWVIGLVIQELDEDKNVVFQWRSWDHFDITDATENIDLTDSVIDYVHGNAIEIDDDGNLLISSRHMDEITKINRQNGEIMWRWGGIKSRKNEFTFINDPVGFSHQHDIRRLPNGNLTVFDNGNLHEPPFSRAAEYQVDEVNKIAALIWEFRNNPETISYAMGSARRLENHNTFIGWGTHTNPAISEVDASGKVVLAVSLPDSMPNYRAFKFDWRTNKFSASPETLEFDYVAEGDSVTREIIVTNNSSDSLVINGLYNRKNNFTWNAELPISLAPAENANISVTFKPDNLDEFNDKLQIRWDSETEGVAQVVTLKGNSEPTTGIEDITLADYELKQNYPNPFNPQTTIAFNIPQSGFVTLKLFDILGNEIETLVDGYKNAGRYDIIFNASNLASGFYIYKIQVNDFITSKKMLLMK